MNAVNNNYENGGSVTLNTACPSAQLLLLERVTPVTQTSVFTDNMPIPMKSFEYGLDKLTEITQEILSDFNYAYIVNLWGGGTCSGYLKSDGTCNTYPSSFNPASPGPIGGTTPSTGNFTSVAVGAPAPSEASMLGNPPANTYSINCVSPTDCRPIAAPLTPFVVGDGRSVTDAVVTASSHTLSSATASFTSADTGKLLLVAMGPKAVVSGTYVSGGSVTGAVNTNCTVTFTNGGGIGATAYLWLQGINTITGGYPIFLTAFGTGYTSAPTAATLSNGSASLGAGAAACSGNIVVSMSIFPLPVLTTATYVDSTTVTLGVSATTSGTGLKATVCTDNTAAISAGIATAQGTGGSVYLPAGDYCIQGLTISAPIQVYGDGVSADFGPDSADDDFPTVAPYLTGTVLHMMAPNTDAIQATAIGQSTQFFNFGIKFDPVIAFWQTGNGINATSGGGNWAVGNSTWQNLKVWGQDGNHYGYLCDNCYLNTYIHLAAFGGGGIHFYSDGGCCSGNSTIIEAYSALMAGGNASGFLIDSQPGGAQQNLYTFIRPETNRIPVHDAFLTWPVPAISQPIQLLAQKDATTVNTSFYSSDWEDVFSGPNTGNRINLSFGSTNSQFGSGTYYFIMRAGGNFNLGCYPIYPYDANGACGFMSTDTDNALQLFTTGYSLPVRLKGSSIQVNSLTAATTNLLCYDTTTTPPYYTLAQCNSTQSVATTGNAGTATKLSTGGTANQVWGMDGTGTNQGWYTPSSLGVLSTTTGSIGGSLLALGCTSEGTVTVTGATTSMACLMSGVGGNPTNVQPQCSVSSAGTVTVQFCTAVAVTPAAQTYAIRVF